MLDQKLSSIFGVALVVEGVLILCIMLGAISSVSVWILLLFLSSLSFLIFLGRNVLPWVLRVTSFVMLSLLLCQLAGPYMGVMLLCVLAAALLLNFLHLPQQWWSFLLAGIMVSSAFQLYLYQQHSLWYKAPIFYLGLAINFSLLYLFPHFWGGRRWAIYPALACLAMTWLTNAPNFRDNPAVALIFIISGGMLLSVARRLRIMKSRSVS